MSLAVLYSRGGMGMMAPLVTVEVHLSRGLPGLSIVGLPEAAVRESRYRVRSAIINSGLDFPIKRITINLAPADLPKEGGRFDLAIALGILAASDQIPKEHLKDYEFVGELALSGELRFVHGILPVVLAAIRDQRHLVIASANADEAVLCTQGTIFVAPDLLSICAHLRAEKNLPMLVSNAPSKNSQPGYPDISEVCGQAFGKRALEIAAAGKHSLLFYGIPGTGKTMLAMRLPGLLPALNMEEALEVAAIYSVCKKETGKQIWRERPFRSPHHSISSVAMVGGSYPPHPGEVSLAHHGVLFLDEFLEFPRAVLEALREPLETGIMSIGRAGYHIAFPADFQLVAAMNPCPCGYWGDAQGRCRCSSEQVRRYQMRLSGPLADRIDLFVCVSPAPLRDARPVSAAHETSRSVRQRVRKARIRQYARASKYNAQLSVKEIYTHCALSSKDETLMMHAIDRFSLSARRYHRI